MARERGECIDLGSDHVSNDFGDNGNNWTSSRKVTPANREGKSKKTTNRVRDRARQTWARTPAPFAFFGCIVTHPFSKHRQKLADGSHGLIYLAQIQSQSKQMIRFLLVCRLSNHLRSIFWLKKTHLKKPLFTMTCAHLRDRHMNRTFFTIDWTIPFECNFARGCVCVLEAQRRKKIQNRMKASVHLFPQTPPNRRQSVLNGFQMDD